jgi:hypothetical protein
VPILVIRGKKTPLFVEFRAFRGSSTFLKFGLTFTKFFARIFASKFPFFVRQKRQD